MKKIFTSVSAMRLLMFMLFVAMSQAWVSCSSEEDEFDPDDPNKGGGSTPVEVTDVSAEDIVGHWQCYYQKWVEAGEEWESSYDIAKDEYYIRFNEDKTGSLGSGDDELMEIMFMNSFEWYVSEGVIYFGTSDSDQWYIQEFTGDEMTLCWIDGEYSITCKFKRYNNTGTYQPFIGPKVVRIDAYRLRNNTTKENFEYYEFEYDAYNRIKKQIHTSTDGRGYKTETIYEYVGDSIKIIVDGNLRQFLLLGENGYVRYDGEYYLNDITNLVYNEDGSLAEVEYHGDDISEKVTYHYDYTESGYTCTQNEWPYEMTTEFGYNIEVKNNASVNLPAFYVNGLLLHEFDFYGKRIPNMVGTVRDEDKYGNHSTDRFNFELDTQGRVVKIVEVDNISPRIWDIYYEGDEMDDPLTHPDTDAGYGKVAEAVDLGLSVKWASWNLGASSETEYGNLYCWSDPDATPGYGAGDQTNQATNISGSMFDIARAQWKGSWRIPTTEEQNELRLNCKWERCVENNIVGLKVTGPNGNSIFLPASGYANEVSIVDQGKNGYYWSASRNMGVVYPKYYFFTTDASQLNFLWSAQNYGAGHYDLNARYGMSIRPVCD